MKDVVGDLDALLTAAHVEGPYLLVGQSLGGTVALAFALTHTQQTAGLVIVDTDWATTDPARTADSLLTPAERAQFAAGDKWDSPDNREHIDHHAVAGEVERAVHPLPGIPIRILTATVPESCDGTPARCALIHQRRVSLQAQWLSLSPKTATRRLVPTGHNIHEEASDLLRDEILAALKDAQHN